MKEIFKDIPEYEGLYKASNFGNIKSLPKKYNGIRYNRFRKDSIILSACISSNGYLMVSLSKNKKKKHFTVHRLIAKTFIKNSENKRCINHKDGNKLNNNINNLEWCTHSENNKHAYDNGMKVANCKSNNVGSKNGQSKLIEYQILTIRNIIEGKTHKEIGILYNVSRATIGDILNRKTWRHI